MHVLWTLKFLTCIRRTHDFQSSILQIPSRTPLSCCLSLIYYIPHLLCQWRCFSSEFCEAGLRFKIKITFYLIADNLFVQKLVFSLPREIQVHKNPSGQFYIVAVFITILHAGFGRWLIPSAWNADSMHWERCRMYVRPFTHSVRKPRQMDACPDLNLFTSTCCDLLTEVYAHWPIDISINLYINHYYLYLFR